MKRRSIAPLLALFAAVFALLAGALPARAAQLNDTVDGTVSDLGIVGQSAPYSVYEGDSYSLSFQLALEAPAGQPFAEGDTYVFETNLGELFTITGENVLEITDASGALLATVHGAPKAVTVRIEAGAAGEVSLAGRVATPAVQALSVGATPEEPVERMLTLGTEQVPITFKRYDSAEPEQDPGTVDFNDLWKNCWSDETLTRAAVSIEVNPLGSINLYLSGNKGRTEKPDTFRQFFVIDEIPAQGKIDPESVEIYASIPAVGTSTGEENNPYGYPEGTLYASRTGTDRRPINGRDIYHNYDPAKDVMTKIEQRAGESIDAFEARVKADDLTWGIYEAADGTQTFMCNFGNIGDPSDNNGIQYADYRPDLVNQYSQIFGEEGASGGNIMQYYIEFDTTYPDLVGTQKLVNHADRWAYKNGETTPSRNGNDATYTISNGGGVGFVESGEVTLRLVDADHHDQPIAGAQFALEEKVGEKWTPTTLTGTTDEKGQLTFDALVAGDTYRLVQTSTPEPYELDSSTFIAQDPNDEDALKGYAVNDDGSFTLAANDAVGYVAFLTNRRPYTASYRFEAADGSPSLPAEVTALLPEDEKHYYGDEVVPVQPAETTVAVADGGRWCFDGYRAEGAYDETTDTLTGDVTFIGQWHYEAPAAVLNRVPTITAHDVTIYVGDAYDVDMHDVMAQDHEDGDLTAASVADASAVDPTTPGTYPVTFRVTDSDGATAQTQATVTVKPLFDVTYQWDGLPGDKTLYDEAGSVVTPVLPAALSSVRDGAEVGIDTAYEAGTTLYTQDDLGNKTGRYTFSGWRVAEPEAGAVIEDGVLTMPAADVVLDGAWMYQELSVAEPSVVYRYTGTLVPEGAEDVLPGASAHRPGETVAVAAAPELEGYVFSGWTTEDADVVNGSFVIGEDDVVFTGSWEPAAVAEQPVQDEDLTLPTHDLPATGDVGAALGAVAVAGALCSAAGAAAARRKK